MEEEFLSLPMTDPSRPPRVFHNWTRLDREVLFVIKRWFLLSKGEAAWSEIAAVFNGFLEYDGAASVGPKALSFQWKQIASEDVYPFTDIYVTSFYSHDRNDYWIKLKIAILKWMKDPANTQHQLRLRIMEDQQTLAAVKKARRTEHAMDERQKRIRRLDNQRKEIVRKVEEFQEGSDPIYVCDGVEILAEVEKKQKISLTVRVEDEMAITGASQETTREKRTIDFRASFSVTKTRQMRPVDEKTRQAMPVRDGTVFEIFTPSSTNPRLLFRFSDETSQGANEFGCRAGAYMHTPEDLIPTAATLFRDNEALRHQYLEAHLNRDKTATPFISLTNSIIWPIMKALKSPSRRTAKIAVIDATMLDEPLYHANIYAKEFGFKHKTHYKAWMEFLACGNIPEKAIVNVFTIDALLGLAQADERLNEIMQLESEAFNCSSTSTVRSRLSKCGLALTASDIGMAVMHMCSCILGGQFVQDIAAPGTTSCLSLTQELTYVVVHNWVLEMRAPGLVKFLPYPEVLQVEDDRHAGEDVNGGEYFEATDETMDD